MKWDKEYFDRQTRVLSKKCKDREIERIRERRKEDRNRRAARDYERYRRSQENVPRTLDVAISRPWTTTRDADQDAEATW